MAKSVATGEFRGVAWKSLCCGILLALVICILCILHMLYWQWTDWINGLTGSMDWLDQWTDCISGQTGLMDRVDHWCRKAVDRVPRLAEALVPVAWTPVDRWIRLSATLMVTHHSTQSNLAPRALWVMSACVILCLFWSWCVVCL